MLVSMRTPANVAAKFAVTVFAPSIRTFNGFAMPLDDPLQPVKTYPGAGVAVSCTLVPAA
jgi:hypothetical protein